MKKLLPFFTLFHICVLYSFGQPRAPLKTDALLVKADKLKSIDPDSALILLNQVKGKIDSVNAPLVYGKWAVINGAIYDNKDDYKLALKYYETGLQCFTKAQNQRGMAIAYNNIGGAWYSMNDFAKARLYYDKALAIRKVTRDTMLSTTYSDIGIIYYEQGDYVKAIKNYIDGIAVAQRCRDTDMLASLASNICVVYWDEKDYPQAMNYAQDALKYHTQLKHYQGMATACNNIGGLYIEQKKYEEGISYFKRAILYAEKVGHLTAIGTAYNNLAETAFDQHKLKIALDYAKRGLLVRRKIAKNHGIIRSLIKVAEISAELKDNNTAKANLDEALSLAKADGNIREQKRIAEKLAVFYKKQGMFEKALIYQEQFQLLSDSIFNKDNIATLHEMQTRFETQKKQQQIQLLNQQNTIQKLTINRRNTLVVVMSTLLVLVIILGYAFYRGYRLKQEARLQATILKQQEEAAKGIIEAEERERKRIAADLHDGVGQLFSSVKLNLESLVMRLPTKNSDDQILAEKTLALVDESCREVRTMAHQMMPNILLKTGLSSAIKEFVTQIDEKSLKINVEISGLNERLDNNTEIVLYRVIQECVNNTIKHAGANKLDIQLHKDEKEISVIIEDNGKGFDTRKETKGIGLKNIESRLAYLKGTVEFSSSPRKGTVVAMYIPLT